MSEIQKIVKQKIMNIERKFTWTAKFKVKISFCGTKYLNNVILFCALSTLDVDITFCGIKYFRCSHFIL